MVTIRDINGWLDRTCSCGAWSWAADPKSRPKLTLADVVAKPPKGWVGAWRGHSRSDGLVDFTRNGVLLQFDLGVHTGAALPSVDVSIDAAPIAEVAANNRAVVELLKVLSGVSE